LHHPGRGATEIEVKERKDRVDDAMHATKAAVEEGVVAGGGVTLLYASQKLDRLNPQNNDEKAGMTSSVAACRRRLGRFSRMPGRGLDHSRQASRQGRGQITLRREERHSLCGHGGKAGIIDPTKACAWRLQGAASIAGLLITTEAMVADRRNRARRDAGPAAMDMRLLSSGLPPGP